MNRDTLRSPRLHFLVGLGLIALGLSLRPSAARVATFNLENYRADDERAEAIFEEIRLTHAALIAVQEVRDPGAFAAAATERLGDEWRFVHADAGHAQRVGVLYDSSRATLLEPARTIESTLIGERAKAALYARFAVDGRDHPARVFVVHLTSGREREETRARQLDALRPWLRRAVRSGDEVLLLGDFNAVTAGDRERVAELADALGFTWATRAIACSTYWQRAEHCQAETLDHILATAADDPQMHGGCAREGCGPMERCPAYRERVSDHCPLSVALP